MPPPRTRLPVITTPRSQVPCLTCGLCCTYVSLEISTPSTVQAATEVLWHLYHEGVSVYRDGDDGWTVQFETRCKHLADDNKCGIYEQRPPICREYEAETCEVNAEDQGRTFYAADDFLAYLKTRSKRVYEAIARRYMPAPEHLGRATPRTKRMAPFDQRFARVRTR